MSKATVTMDVLVSKGRPRLGSGLWIEALSTKNWLRLGQSRENKNKSCWTITLNQMIGTVFVSNAVSQMNCTNLLQATYTASSN